MTSDVSVKLHFRISEFTVNSQLKIKHIPIKMIHSDPTKTCPLMVPPQQMEQVLECVSNIIPPVEKQDKLYAPFSFSSLCIKTSENQASL